MLNPVITLMGSVRKKECYIEEHFWRIGTPKASPMMRGFTIFYLSICISISPPLSSLWSLIRNHLRERRERERMNLYFSLSPLFLFSIASIDFLYHQRKHIKMLFLKIITEIQNLLPANLQDNDSKQCPR